METFAKKLTNLLRILVWYADYTLFRSIQLLNGEKKLPKTFKNILIIELLYIGDVIAITPSIRALKQRFPYSNIDVMLRPSMEEVLIKNPNINKILTYDKQDFEKGFDTVTNKIKGKYDLAILFHPGIDIGNYKISKLLKNAEIPFRIGCTKTGFLEGKGFFLHRKTRPTFILKHKINDNLDVIKTIGVDTKDKHLEIYTTKEAEDYIETLLKKEGVVKHGGFIVMHAAPQHKTHEWVIERFANVADELIRKYKAKIVLTGSQKDKDYNQKIISLMGHEAINLAGKTGIQQLFATIKRANLVISVDTSAIHIAAAFDKSVIALFGAGNPKIWGPYCKKSFVIFKEEKNCTSCMKHRCKKGYKCMKSITEKDVLEGVKKLMDSN